MSLPNLVTPFSFLRIRKRPPKSNSFAFLANVYATNPTAMARGFIGDTGAGFEAIVL